MRDVERVDIFCYLGHWIAVNASIESEVQARISRAAGLRDCLCQSVVGRRQLSGRTNYRLFAAIVIPSLTYGAETWLVPNSILHKRVPESLFATYLAHQPVGSCGDRGGLAQV